jgi:hypothetical protein
MKNNNTENNIMNHKDALEKADERAEIGKKHITDIAMTCSNDYTVIDSLMCILELFTVNDADVRVGDLANELQGYLFQWTKEYGNAMDGWKDSVMFGTKYKEVEDDPGTFLSQGSPGESLKPSDTAKQVSDLLNNPDLPEPVRDGLQDGLLDLFNSHINQSEFHDYEKSPEYVEKILRGYQAAN